MLFAGLTGNYGMGKSFVLSVFRDLGAVTIDSDEIVHALLQKKTIIGQIVKLLGRGVLGPDGSLDRKRIAREVFRDDELRKGLEAILHRRVFREITRQTQPYRSKHRIVIVEVPLLFEAGHDIRFRRLITVFTSQRVAFDRLKKTGIPRKDALARLKVQLPIAEKKRRSDFVINNSFSKARTREQVGRVYLQLLKEMA